jgi:hypothetical protein
VVAGKAVPSTQHSQPTPMLTAETCIEAAAVSIDKKFPAAKSAVQSVTYEQTRRIHGCPVLAHKQFEEEKLALIEELTPALCVKMLLACHANTSGQKVDLGLLIACDGIKKSCRNM